MADVVGGLLYFLLLFLSISGAARKDGMGCTEGASEV